ncbi:hypothetical protein ACF3N7_06295 [Cruoricaptor ignavus]|uniref:hypothetical protein n=1 Tax=Cruoricaptor ignavus TaxID=1118202 RepID=UPI00370D3A64
MKKLLLFLYLTISFSAYSQKIENFDLKKFRVATLPAELRETSGLAFYKGELITINDSGNSSEIFVMDKRNGAVKSRIKLPLRNYDWEAISTDSTSIFVADFGNNAGNRKDLQIHKISLPVDSSSIKSINFFYPEQTDFAVRFGAHDFDAEALIIKDGKLNVFTKEWASRGVKRYILNDEAELQPAQKIEEFSIGFMVTDAAYFRQKLYFVGYTKKLEVFMAIFDEDDKGLFFNTLPKKYFLGESTILGQIEGIAVNDEGIYISGEEFNARLFKVPQSFYFIPHEKFPVNISAE